MEELKLFCRGGVDGNEKKDLAGSEILDSVG